jgi:GT2 family glycosyltransferase
MRHADVLMITHERPQYVRLSLRRLLDGCPDGSRIWVWHNGTHAETLDAVLELRDHPRFHRFHHSPDNVGLRTPTNWLWREAEGAYLGKVDDDSLMEPGWIEALMAGHARWRGLGALGSWRFMDEDFRPRLAARKLQRNAGVTILRNHWVQGSGYLVPRHVVRDVGELRERESFYWWCLRVARAGYLNGWLYPFVHEEHMDDPRSPHTIFVDDEAFMARRPLSAKATGVTTVAGWLEQTRRDAAQVQRASLRMSTYYGWRLTARKARMRLQRTVTGRATW